VAFESVPGLAGRVFVPDKQSGEGKHPCPDCYACQQCGEDRCRVCRLDRPAPPGSAPPKDGCCKRG